MELINKYLGLVRYIIYLKTKMNLLPSNIFELLKLKSRTFRMMPLRTALRMDDLPNGNTQQLPLNNTTLASDSPDRLEMVLY